MLTELPPYFLSSMAFRELKYVVKKKPGENNLTK
jgi:hypothetical protein